MMKHLLLFFLLASTSQLFYAQAPGANCDSAGGCNGGSNATPITLIPGTRVITGDQSTAGLGNNYNAAVSPDSCQTGLGFYGDANDGVYSIEVVDAGDYIFDFANSGTTWKSLSIHSDCPTATNSYCVGGILTGGARSGMTTVTLTPGTYYLIVDGWSVFGISNNFNLRITSPIANDECAGATRLTSNISCSSITTNNTGSTDSGGTAPTCGSYSTSDVWFSYEVNSTGALTVTTDGAVIDAAAAVYSGTCGALTQIACDDDGGPGNTSLITLTGRTPGEILYIRVWDFFDGQGDFDICVTTPVPVGNNGVVLNCSGEVSREMTSDITCATGTTSLGSTINGNLNAGTDPQALQLATGLDSGDPCAFKPTDMANYEAIPFTVTVTGTYVFEMTASTDNDPQGYILVNDAFYNPGSCTSTYVDGDDDNASIVLFPQITTTLTAGTNYMLITTAFGFGSTTHTGPYTWTVTAQSPPVEWYTTAVGGTPIGTGAGFNPVGVAGSGITDTSTAGLTSFWVACPATPAVRTQVDYVIGKVWDGSVDDNWYEDNNWTPAGIPGFDDCVVIPDNGTVPNNPIADQLNAPPLPPTTPAKSKRLTLLADAYLEVATNTELMVKESVNIQGTGILNLKSSASLIQMDDRAINSGNIHVQRSPNFDESALVYDQYVYWSSPVANFQVDDISPGSNLLYEWTPTAVGNGAGDHGEWATATGTMNCATGYIVRGLGGTPATIPATGYAIPSNTALFSGVPNNGVISKQIFHGNYNGAPYAGVGTTATNEDDNWNLIGNPYPSAISANAFVDFNTNINGTVYLWDHTGANSLITGDPFYEDFVYNYDGTDYFEHNNTGSNPPGTNDLFIGSGQGFFVFMNHAATPGSAVTFNNSMRYDNTIDDLIPNFDNSTFYRENNTSGNEENAIERHRMWLDLLSPNAVTNSILVGYITNATNNFDRLYDGYDFSGDDSAFYSISDDERLSIQGRALPFSQEDSVPLGIVTSEAGSHTIAINTLDGLFLEETQGIYIEDTELNYIHNLRNAPYTFTISAGRHNDRFVLRYNDDALSIDDAEDLSALTILAPKSEYVKINATKSLIDTVIIYDLLGRPLINTANINKSEFTINNHNLADGAYIVKVTLSNGLSKMQKVILKR